MNPQAFAEDDETSTTSVITADTPSHLFEHELRDEIRESFVAWKPMSGPLRIVTLVVIVLTVGSLIPLLTSSISSPQINAGTLLNGVPLQLPQPVVLTFLVLLIPAFILLLGSTLQVHPAVRLPLIFLIVFILVTPPLYVLRAIPEGNSSFGRVIIVSRIIQVVVSTIILLWGIISTIRHRHQTEIASVRFRQTWRIFLGITGLLVAYEAMEILVWLYPQIAKVSDKTQIPFLQADVVLQVALILPFIGLVLYWTGSALAGVGRSAGTTLMRLTTPSKSSRLLFLLPLLVSLYVIWDTLSTRSDLITSSLILTIALAVVATLVTRFAHITLDWSPQVSWRSLVVGVIFIYLTNSVIIILNFLPLFLINRQNLSAGQQDALNSAWSILSLTIGGGVALWFIARGRQRGKSLTGTTGLLLFMVIIMDVGLGLPDLLNGIHFAYTKLPVMSIDSIRLCAALYVLGFTIWVWLRREHYSEVFLPLSRAFILVFGLQVVTWLLYLFQFLGNLTLLPTAVTSTLFIGLILWDFLTSGGEMTNGNSKSFPHGARVAIYLGYTLIATSLFLYNGSLHILGLNAANPSQGGVDLQTSWGLLGIGVPIIVTEFFIGMARWRAHERHLSAEMTTPRRSAILFPQVATIGSGILATGLVGLFLISTLAPLIGQRIATPGIQAAYISHTPGFGCDPGGAYWLRSPDITIRCTNQGVVLHAEAKKVGTLEFVPPEGLGNLTPKYAISMKVTFLTPTNIDDGLAHYCAGVIMRLFQFEPSKFAGNSANLCDNGIFGITHYRNVDQQFTDAPLSSIGQVQITRSYAMTITVDGSTTTYAIAGNGGVTAPDATYHLGEHVGLSLGNSSDEPVEIAISDFIYAPLNGSSERAILPDYVHTMPVPKPDYQTYIARQNAWGLNIPTTFTHANSEVALSDHATFATNFADEHTFAAVTSTPTVIEQSQLLKNWGQIVALHGKNLNYTSASAFYVYWIGPYTWEFQVISVQIDGVPYRVKAYFLKEGQATYTFLAGTPESWAADPAQHWETAVALMVNSFTVAPASENSTAVVQPEATPRPIPTPTPTPTATPTLPPVAVPPISGVYTGCFQADGNYASAPLILKIDSVTSQLAVYGSINMNGVVDTISGSVEPLVNNTTTLNFDLNRHITTFVGQVSIIARVVSFSGTYSFPGDTNPGSTGTWHAGVGQSCP